MVGFRLDSHKRHVFVFLLQFQKKNKTTPKPIKGFVSVFWSPMVVENWNESYGRYLKMPQKAFEGGIFHVRAYVFFPEMPQNRTYSFSVFKSITYFFLEMPHFFMFVFAEMPHFFHLILNLKTRKQPKMNMFDFGAFQEKIAYALTWKIPPSNAFWDTSRIFGLNMF